MAGVTVELPKGLQATTLAVFMLTAEPDGAVAVRELNDSGKVALVIGDPLAFALALLETGTAAAAHGNIHSVANRRDPATLRAAAVDLTRHLHKE